MPPEPEPPVISAEDNSTSGLFPKGFTDLYEVHSYRNAARILRYACEPEFNELISKLMGFRIKTADMVAGGKNKSKIAIDMDKLLHPLGWHETRIAGDLYIRLMGGSKPKAKKPKKGKGAPAATTEPEPYDFKIPRFVDGHKIDFVKERVAFDMEWNSKDQTFDRDLYAMRTFYDCNIITVGVLLTRSADLKTLFAEIQNRTAIKGFKSKYGASTTWMDKLIYRMNAGRAGGCPILVLGIKPSVVSDFEEWTKAHPVKSIKPFEIEAPEGEETEDSEESEEGGGGEE
ncbi:MAG: hypothetical protein K2X11_11985 [Acetobacteraceae bacterium]|nr:hypothetical protein [Acetobacteraceae bacterium]